MSSTQKTAGAIGHGVRRLCVAVDLEHYSQQPDFGQVEAQRAMSELLKEAGRHGALERAQWDIQPQGDGELALLPPGIDEAYVVGSLMREVSSGLHLYNRHASDAARLRMRIAVHEGITYVADSGFAGDAVNTVCRLRDAEESKDALRAARGDLVLIASERIFHDVICGSDAYDLPPADFRETEIVMDAKGFRARAFIYAGTGPAAPKPPEPAQPRQASQRERSAAPVGVTFSFGNDAKTGDIAARDLYKGADGAVRDATGRMPDE